MTTQDLILQLLLGGILGIAGQGLRVLVGLKKLFDKSQQESRPFTELFSATFLLISIFMGFVAGVLATCAISDAGFKMEINKEAALSLIGSGYAGADFIEGFVSKYFPKSARTSQQPTTNEPDEQPAIG